MRIVRLRSTAFGGLRELDTGEAPLPGLVVVQGRNEAGKSTFFELVSTALYGFYPSSREAHPYAPWDGTVPEVEARIALQDGGEVVLQRRLLSAPQGSLRTGAIEESIRNRTLPAAEHVPRPVFRNVFALTLGELAGLEGESWNVVQDRLLDAMGATDLRSARQVADELEAEAARLWRPNRRGSQEVRNHEERIRELRLRRHEAATQEAEVRRLSRELEDVRRWLANAREEREECRIYIERFRSLLPIRDQLLRVEGLEEDAGDPSLLDALPSRPAQRRDELQDRIAELVQRREELSAAAAHPRETLAAVHPTDEEVASQERSIEELVASQAALEPTRVRAGQLEQELRDLERRLDAGARKLLDRSMESTLRDRILEVPVGALESAVLRLIEARKRMEGLTSARSETIPPSAEAPLWLPLGVILTGIVALALTRLYAGVVLPMVGTVCLGAGVVLTYDWMRRRSRVQGEDSARRKQEEDRTRLVAEREEELEEADQAVRRILAPLEPGEHAPVPGPDYAAQMERLQDLVRDESDRKRSMGLALREIEAVNALGDPLRVLLPEGDRDADIPTVAYLLSRALKGASARREAAAAARRELERVEREQEKLDEETASTREELARLDQQLTELGGGELDRGIQEAEARITAGNRARQIMEELRENNPDLEEIRGRIREAEARGDDWAVDRSALAHRRAREQSLTEEIEELRGRVQGIETELRHLRKRTTLDELDGEVLALREEMRALLVRRDRLWVQARVIREAERRLREEHQPAILREAGRRLAALTEGRYDRILLAGRDGRSFRVRGPATPEPLPIDRPLSTGTREQIYLALRLSILDQLDRSGERLPLLLDELLVNWDAPRRGAGLELLREISRERQTFFFTCHPEMADRLEELGARRVRLAGP